MKTCKYFAAVEFTRCTPSCSIENMDSQLLATLDKLREAAGIPLVLNSAYRSPAYERSKGRTGTGAHTRGTAVDIRCNTSANRWKILKAAYALNIPRVGIGASFIHIDIDRQLPQRVAWDYYTSNDD